MPSFDIQPFEPVLTCWLHTPRTERWQPGQFAVLALPSVKSGTDLLLAYVDSA